jgi:2-methylisocitrate lyase-like PEP mutase family enzyme
VEVETVMTTISQQTKAALFRDLHHAPPILILPNAWDAASAKLFELAGFKAIGTTSAGIAHSLGYIEPQRISREEMLQSVRRITKSVQLPVSADMEAGYAFTSEGVAETVKGVIAAGAVGINLEDSPGDAGNPLVDPALHAAKIRAARAAADALGMPFVINARTDVYLFAVGESSIRFDNAVRRANAYRKAGADCLFVPGVADPEIIARLVREIHGPVNILANPGVPSATELERLGVVRVSMGSGPMRATMALVRRIAKELMETGTYKAFTDDTIPYAEVNRLFQQ